MGLMSINTDSISLGILLEQIKIARNRMQQLWNEKGYTDAEVLIASIEVDRLINEYQRVTGFLTQILVVVLSKMVVERYKKMKDQELKAMEVKVKELENWG